MTNAKALLTFLVTLGMFGAIYVVYRYYESRSVWNDYFSGKSVSPTLCMIAESGFEAAQQAVVYFKDTSVSMTAHQRIRGEKQIRHIVSTDTKTFYLWDDAHAQGLKGTRREIWSEPDFNTLGVSLSCTPWWSTDDSVFELPTLLRFEPVTR